VNSLNATDHPVKSGSCFPSHSGKPAGYLSIDSEEIRAFTGILLKEIGSPDRPRFRTVRDRPLHLIAALLATLHAPIGVETGYRRTFPKKVSVENFFRAKSSDGQA
jgi:hypothetical protein